MKHYRYLKYVAVHKLHVLRASIRLGIPLRGLIHDLSKFRPDEWGPYAEWFYGEYPQGRNEIKRGLPPQNTTIKWWTSTMKHYHRNPHHWQHWLLFREDGLKAMPIPIPVLKEMLADWYGVAVALGAVDGWKSAYDWWQLHQSDMFMYPDSKQWIEANLKHLAFSGTGK
jgi:hypothetical protein